MPELPDEQSTSMDDVKQLGLFAAIASLSYVFWVVGAMEMVEAFDWLIVMTGETSKSLTDVLYQTHNVPMVWYIMGAVGIASALGIYIYGVWIQKIAREEKASV